MRKWPLKEGNTQSGDQNDFIQTRIKTKIAQCFDYNSTTMAQNGG